MVKWYFTLLFPLFLSGPVEAQLFRLWRNYRATEQQIMHTYNKDVKALQKKSTRRLQHAVHLFDKQGILDSHEDVLTAYILHKACVERLARLEKHIQALKHNEEKFYTERNILITDMFVRAYAWIYQFFIK